MITYDGNIYPDKDAGLVTQLTKKYEDLGKFEDNHPGLKTVLALPRGGPQLPLTSQ
jgi:hypothetical protein